MIWNKLKSPPELSKIDTFFCTDLPTKPLKKKGLILVTGASGYIGGRLVPELINRGYKVRILVRSHTQHYRENWPGVEVVLADALDPDSLKDALKDVDTAYYLIHSLLLGPRQFRVADVKAAQNFRKAAESNGLSRIIYLGGLGDINSSLSEHLSSRIQVAEELQKGKVSVTILRAAIIIGSGSASYEMLHHVVKKLSIISVPGWTDNRCQPIGIRDVIKYLVGSFEASKTKGRSLDIGGQDILTYKEMILRTAEVFNKKVRIITMPFMGFGLASYLINLLTPVPAPLVRCLLESGKNEVICLDNSIRELIQFEPLTFTEAIERALTVEEQYRVMTRWSDSYPRNHKFATKLHEIPGKPRFSTTYKITTFKNHADIFNSICKIGGNEGWFNSNWMWRLRGMVDEMLMGVGISRGRKSYPSLKINDVIDFWRVEDIKKNKRLLLRAEMKLPGNAWLEFNIQPRYPGNYLSVTGYYDTNTIPGKMYWYTFLPFHHFIFNDLIKEIEKRS